jgi:glutaminyl-peptide cyclotransferase
LNTDLIKQAKDDLMHMVQWQVDFGPRYPGSTSHKCFRKALHEILKEKIETVYIQDFAIRFLKRQTECSNIIGIIPCKNPLFGPILIGTHFDTRLIADNETNPEKLKKPILGANDGGSGTAILLYLSDWLATKEFNRDILLVLFDAEDVGAIEGNRFAMGARYFVDNPLPFLPEEIIILDMVGGKRMILDIDKHTHFYPRSFEFTRQIFSLGMHLRLSAFTREKKNKRKYIICDHTPFLLKSLPACLLMDMDYPQWHTHNDRPEVMSGTSLFMIYTLLKEYLRRFIR